ncbi:MAG: 4-hydroxybutyrate CoA-transferase [Clostridiales Family XIII bacterium]|nr:4-hydroxybutyrate CoA-transferase [Clostridiales Family XIII bacterium]
MGGAIGDLKIVDALLSKEHKRVYQEKLTTAEEAVKLIKSFDHVLLAHCVGEPKALITAMVNNYKNYENVKVHSMVRLGPVDITAPEMQGHFIGEPMFSGGNSRLALKEGRAEFIPMFFHEVPKNIREKKLPVDVILVQLSPPDENGYCSLGTSVDYTLQGIKTAKTVLAQINRNMPRTYGDSFVHINEFTKIIEADEPLYEVPSIEPSETEKKIGEYCASLVEDGSTLQLGIGGIPDAVMLFLEHKKDLGIHSEMIADGTLKLFEKGVITNKYKNFDKGKMTVTFLMGTKKLYNFANNNPAVQLMPVDYINHPAVVMKQHKMVSINSAIEVDFQGQVNAEAVGKNQFSGVGGQVDFIRGVSMGKDGKAIIAMPSVTIKKDGSMISKIIPAIEKWAPITTSRNDIDYVVTEYGIAELKAKTLPERARNLINIAHPKVRDELIAAFKERFLVKF